MSEGLFTGEIRVCFPVRCKSRDEWMLTMAAPAADGERLSGAVASLDCADAVFKGRPFVLTRHHRAQPVALLAPPSEGNSRPRKMSAEAQRLFREGMEHSSLGRYDAARGKFEAAGRLEPRNADVLTQIGITYYARGNHSEAERHYRRAVAADPSHTVAYYNLACVLAKQDKVRDALRELRRAVDSGFSSVTTMDDDRDLDPLRRDAAFREIRSLAERNAAKAGH
jgi:tetratricopeptide (TPR) repeat protein